MSDQIQDQISAFVDDELSFDECLFLVRRFERDPQARHKVVSYLTIGAALRGELLQSEPTALGRRIGRVIRQDADQQTPAHAARANVAMRRLLKPALGVAIAASVAVAAVLVLRVGGQAPLANAPEPVATTAAVSAPEPQSYVVPQERSQPRNVTQPIRLTNYVVHHGEYVSGLPRTWIHSSVVGMQEATLTTEEGDTTDQ